MILVRCPDCKDHVRMPDVQPSDAIELRCPLCGSTSKSTYFLSQLPPALEIVHLDNSPETNAEPAFFQPSNFTDNNERETQDDTSDSSENPIPASNDFTPQPAAEFNFLGSQPIDSFDVGAEGLQPRPKRRPPSVLKMLIQWVGGGFLGIGIALGILIYLKKVPPFVPYFGEHFSRTSSTAPTKPPAPARAFVPRKSSRSSNKKGQSSFFPVNENSELLASIDTSEGAKNPADSEAADSSEGQSLHELNASESSEIEGRVADARENLSALSTYKGGDRQVFRDLAIDLYRSLALIGESTVDEISKTDARLVKSLLSELADDQKTQDLLRRYAPFWIKRTDRGTNGVVLLTKLADQAKFQKRPGFRSVLVQSESPITIFAPMPRIQSSMNKQAIILGAMQTDLSDISGVGILVHVGAIQPL